MRIDLTVVGSDGTARDVALEAPGSTPVADVACALGVDASALAIRGLASGEDLASSGLRSGAVLPAPNPAAPSPSLALTVTGGRAAGLVLPLRRGRLVIGRTAACDLVLPDERVSRRHAELVVAGGVVSVRDLGSAHGTWLDERRVGPDPVALAPDQPLRVGDAELVVRVGPEPSVPSRRTADGRVLVRRAPRALPPMPEAEIVLPRPPERPRASFSVGALLPALGGIGLAAALASPLYLAVAALAPAALVAEAGAGRLRGRRARRRALRTFRDAVRAAEGRLTTAQAVERAGLRAQAPDPAALARTAAVAGPRLWERRSGDPDLLAVRLGFAATVSGVRVRRGDSLDPPAQLGDLPTRIDLGVGPLGITGPDGAARALARWVVLQLAVLMAPSDLRFQLFCTPTTAGHWRWARWLPHLRGVALTDDEQADAAALLAGARGPCRAVAVGDGLPGRISAALCDLSSERGLGLVLVSPTASGLPAGCAWVADMASATLTRPSAERAALRPDGVSVRFAESVARDLAPLDSDDDAAAALPERCSLIALLGLSPPDPSAIAERWRRGDGRLATPLGTDGRRAAVLDLQRDGPHALVAGTTGSGKSELLRSLVLGLAATLPPDALQFLLFDFKGGATFAGLARLPHTVAVLTDLDASVASRALQSLQSELQRRERLLAEAGAADLDRYSPVAGGERLARLVVVIDEFAALAASDERLIPALVSVAQRGRSLGLHLVLATQRPGACVSADVRANTNVRIALRTVSGADSIDVLDVPDAAGLDPRRPGLALLSAGGKPVLFQAAGAAVPPDTGARGVTLTPLDEWRRPVQISDAGADQEAAVVELVEALRAAAPSAAARSPLWLPPLRVALPLGALAPAADPECVPWALVDLPEHQRQETLSVDLRAGGSVLLTGGPGSGRTTALAALGVSAAARLGTQLHLHVIDPAGRLGALSRLPAAGTVAVGSAAVETAAALVAALRAEVESRARSFGPGVPGVRAASARPPLLLLVDGWEDLCAAAEPFDAGRCADQLLDLMRCCGSAGVTVVLSGDRASLAGRVTGAATRRFLLPLADRADYSAAGVPVAALPAEPPPGRALRVPDGAALQFGFVGAAPDRWGEAVERLASTPGRTNPQAPAPIRIRELPPSVRLAEVRPAAGDPAPRLSLTIGVGGSAATPIVVDLERGARTLLVSGPIRSGRSTVLLSALLQLGARPGVRAAVVASGRSPLRRYAAAEPLPAGSDGAEALLLLIDDCDSLAGTPDEDRVLAQLASPAASVSVVASVRSDRLALSYRGLVAELRQLGSALLLQPTTADAETFGIALPRTRGAPIAGRGILVTDPAWALSESAPRVQVALP